MAGNMKVPLLREELVQAQYQQAVERSVVNYLYTGSRSTGILANYTADSFRVDGMFSNGISDGLYGGGVATSGGAVVSTNNSPALAADTEYAFTVRGEWLAAGVWDQFDDYTSPRREDTGVMLGGAIHTQHAEYGAALPDIQLTVFTFDASAEFGGANVYGSVTYSHVNMPSGTPNIEPWGIVLGGGGYVTDTWELFGRYEYSDTNLLSEQSLSILTVGATKYFAGHNAKWTTDIGIGLEALTVGTFPNGVAVAPVTGWREDITTEDGQIVIRSQMQILF